MFKRVSHQDKLFFTKHLSIMLKSGITIADAITILSEQTESKAFQKLLSSMMKRMQNGQPLSRALEDVPHVFDPLFVNIVKVGETSGTLVESLEFLSSQLEKDYRLRKKIQNALLYPSIVLLAAALIGGFISLFILPQLVGFFDTLNVELPITTRILLFVATTMRDYGLYIMGGIFLASIGLNRFVKTPIGKPLWHKALLQAPLVGKLVRYYVLARLCRNLGILIKSGIPIAQGIETTKETIEIVPYALSLDELSEKIKKGHSLAKSMETLSRVYFPPLVTKMIGVGEHTGELDKTLMYLGDFYEEEVDSISQNLTPILEPILLLIIGAVVGFIALAIISPIYELTGSIR